MKIKSCSLNSHPAKKKIGIFKLGFLSIAAVVLAYGALNSACAPESPKLVTPPIAKIEKVVDAGDTKVTFNRNVDILFVVDDSGSMGPHQTNLAKNVKLFTKGILQNQVLDYHIGVLNSSMSGCSVWGKKKGYACSGELNGIVKYVTRTTPSADATLEYNLQPGTSGSPTEEFFTPVIAALTPPKVGTVNTGFYRPDAYLAVIFVTDTDDQSRVTASDFYKKLLAMKGGDASKVIAYAAHIPTTDKTCDRSDEELPVKLEAFFKLTSAKVFDLCDADFGLKFADIGADLVRRVGSILYLTRAPQPHTIIVTYGKQVIPNDPIKGWVYDPSRNALSFGDDIDLQPEPAGTLVQVDFLAAQY